MSAVNETLRDLVERRLQEMGQRRGRGEKISLREAHQRLDRDKGPWVSYETVRRIREIGHSNINEATAGAIATMLDVPLDEVMLAAGQRPVLGPFELPARADRLTESERAAVLGVVDAILDAAQDGVRAHTGPNPGQRALKAVAKGGARSDADEADRIARRARGQQSAD